MSFLVFCALLCVSFFAVRRLVRGLQEPPKGLRDFGHWFRLSVLADLGFMAESVKRRLRWRRERPKDIDWDDEARRFLQGDS